MADPYASSMLPALLSQYQALLAKGLPPVVARSILTQPSTGEGDVPVGMALGQPFGQWPYPYAGAKEEIWAGQQGQRDQALNQQIGQALLYQGPQALYGGKGAGMNLPTYEGHTPGEDDNLGFTRLPSGQYVPMSPMGQQGLQAWQPQAPPSLLSNNVPSQPLNYMQWMLPGLLSQ